MFDILFLTALALGEPPTTPVIHSSRGQSAPAATLGKARFEPGDKRILHFVGGTIGQYDIIDSYTSALGDALAPVGDSMWLDIPGTRSWDKVLGGLKSKLERLKSEGRMLNLGIGFADGSLGGFSTAGDAAYANTTAHDAQVESLGKVLAASGVPVFVRIGVEINGDWNGLHPYVFPQAFRKMVRQFRDLGCRNVASVFCVEPRGDSEIFAVDEQDRPKWFPGDDVIDWYGIDIYPATCFSGSTTNARIARGKDIRRATDRFLERARKAGKPVFIGETSCFPHVIPSDADDPEGVAARKVWQEWFQPFIAWLDEHPEIKAVAFCPVDWSQTGAFSTWGDARIQRNSKLTALWRAELEDPRWFHLKELPFLLPKRP